MSQIFLISLFILPFIIIFASMLFFNQSLRKMTKKVEDKQEQLKNTIKMEKIQKVIYMSFFCPEPEEYINKHINALQELKKRTTNKTALDSIIDAQFMLEGAWSVYALSRITQDEMEKVAQEKEKQKENELTDNS